MAQDSAIVRSGLGDITNEFYRMSEKDNNPQDDAEQSGIETRDRDRDIEASDVDEAFEFEAADKASEDGAEPADNIGPNIDETDVADTDVPETNVAETDTETAAETEEGQSAPDEATQAESEKNINEVKDDEDAPSQSSVEPSSNVVAQAAPKHAAGRGISILALLISLVAGGAAGFFGWQLLDQKRQISVSSSSQAAQTANVAETVDRQFAEIATLRRDFESLEQAQSERGQRTDKAFTDLTTRVDESRAVIDSHARRLLSLAATTTDDWRIAEVDYLLRLASQRLLISSDVRTALELMGEADKILLELADPRLLPARRAIAEDRAALNLVAKLDIDGMFLRLSALGSQVDSLPVVSAPRFEIAGPDNGANTGEETLAVENEEPAQAAVWVRTQEVFARGWREIRSWVVINRPDAQIKPMLPPEQQYYLRNNLKLLLNQAQIALLEKRSGPFQSSLDTAIQWLQDYFPPGEQAISTTILELQQLRDTEIDPDIPDMSSSLLAIKGFINERFSSQSATGTEPKQENQADESSSQEARR